MEPTESKFNFIEGRKTKQKAACDYSQGITKSLLEKYKPSRTLVMLEVGKKDIKNLRAA